MVDLKLRLLSNFSDYYDFSFDGLGEEFRRFTTDGLSRPAMLTFLGHHGFNPPKHGKVWEIAMDCPKLVVYTDERSHRGEGKLLLGSKEAMEQYPGSYASEYIESAPQSLRLLQVGIMRWMLSYRSDDAWRSNVGSEVEISILSEHVGYSLKIAAPLFAIDFVTDRKGAQYAVDFNVAPGLKWTGIDDRMKPEDIVNLIKDGVLRQRTLSG